MTKFLDKSAYTLLRDPEHKAEVSRLAHSLGFKCESDVYRYLVRQAATGLHGYQADVRESDEDDEEEEDLGPLTPDEVIEIEEALQEELPEEDGDEGDHDTDDIEEEEEEADDIEESDLEAAQLEQVRQEAIALFTNAFSRQEVDTSHTEAEQVALCEADFAPAEYLPLTKPAPEAPAFGDWARIVFSCHWLSLRFGHGTVAAFLLDLEGELTFIKDEIEALAFVADECEEEPREDSLFFVLRE